MCGIIATLRTHRRAAELLDALGHRGPDAEGWLDLGICSLAMTRLAILDRHERSDQPMAWGDATIVFNGEIYNFADLRTELRSLGWTFDTAGDTEVLLKSLLQWGPMALSRIRGMYAFLLWRADTEELWAGRDKFGIKPLYWGRVAQGGVCFASEAKALTEFGDRRVAGRAVAEFLHFGSPYTTTAFDGVVEVTPGALSIWRPDGSIDISRSNGYRLGERTAAELVADAVSSHLVSDRPVALFLSGGFDSALIASQVAASANPPTAITIDTGDNSLDVSGARRTAEHYGLALEVISYPESDIGRRLDDYVRLMDQPTIDGFNTFLVSDAANNAGFPVALSGLGGDEVLGGYGYYRRAAWMARAGALHRHLPERVQTRVDRVLADRTRRAPSQIGSILAAQTISDRYRSWRCLFTAGEAEYLTGIRPSPPPSVFPDLTEVDRADFRVLDFDMYLRSTLLRDVDIFSMACGVEVRVPLLDQPFVEQLSLRSPALDKAGMARALGDAHLSEILARRKMTFSLPWTRWLPALERGEEIIGGGHPWRDLIDPLALRRLLDDPTGEQASRRLALDVLRRWLQHVGATRRVRRRRL